MAMLINQMVRQKMSDLVPQIQDDLSMFSSTIFVWCNSTSKWRP